MAADIVARAEDAPRGLRWTYGPWQSERMKALTEEQRSGFWMWLPITLFLPIVAVVLLASAAVEFAR